MIVDSATNGTGRPTVWFDVTTAAGCPPPATGIPRVEANLAAAICDADPSIRLCVYEAPLGRYSAVDVDAYRTLMAMRRRAPDAVRPVDLDVHRFDRRDVGGLGIFAPDDVLVTCGLNWRPGFGNLALVHALRRAIGLRAVTMCHDLIPILFPRLIPGMDVPMAAHLSAMVRHADHVLCISRRTQQDLLEWAAALDLRPRATSVVPLGTELDVGAPPTATHVTDPAVRPEIAALLDTPFVLSVGTLEDRKNQRVLCDAMGRLVDGGAVDLPRLVLVGGLGVGGAQLIESIATDARLRDRVVVLSDATDAELSRLYARCRFTLYPSLYEGWGLPVRESLARGRFCVASDRGAVPEAGGPFCDYLDPHDVDAWAAAIDRCVRNEAYVASREAAIRASFRPVSWRETAARVLDVVAGLP